MELLIGLTGALIGALAVVITQILNARSARRLEEQRQLRADVAQATRSLLEALQAQQWLVWKAAFDPESLTDADIESYDQAASKGLALIVGHLGVLSATWPEVFRRYSPLATAIMRFDQEIAESTVDFRRDRAAGVDRIGRLAEKVLPYHWYAYAQVSRVVEGEKVENYHPARWHSSEPMND